MDLEPFWSEQETALLTRLNSSRGGLSNAQAREHRKRYGPNIPPGRAKLPRLALFWNQFKSPVSILLLLAATLSLAVGDTAEGSMVFGILLGSSLLGCWQELRSTNAIEQLLRRIEAKSAVVRGGVTIEIERAEIVPGDLILLEAGESVAADCRIIQSKDLFVDEAALTGESYASEKLPGTLPSETEISSRNNVVFQGSHILSGEARAIVTATGKSTIFGSIVSHLVAAPPPTEFERGVRKFGYLLLEVTFVMAIAVLAINLGLHRPVLESLLFTLALTVGLTPQLLPAIVTICLSHGASRMSERDAIVRRLSAIADIGGIDVLCSDKTGTITEGAARWEGALSTDGKSSDRCRLLGYLNAKFETGFGNPIDEAIRAVPHPDGDKFRKLDEVPYDFTRRRLSVLVERADSALMITKGALREVLAVCSLAERSDGTTAPISEMLPEVDALFERLSKQGYRCLGLACREEQKSHTLTQESEREMTFLGILTFLDPPKAGAKDSIENLRSLGISCKIITGDNRFVAANVMEKLGLDPKRMMTGAELRTASEAALPQIAKSTDAFVEVDPNQKLQIVLALKRAGFSVGYLGDGINDAAALRAADVGISVDSAVEVTKQAADIVLTKKDLSILADAVREGRSAFRNTLKYIYITTSANFGNMFSMGGASLFSSFLPLLPRQILLLNVLSDLPEMAIVRDRNDAEMIARPCRWNPRAIGWFMAIFGLLSSAFDYLTFGFLLLAAVPAPVFRTGWFLESVLSQLLILLVIRTPRFVLKSPVDYRLLGMSAVVACISIALPYSPLAPALGMQPIPPHLAPVLGAIIVAYAATAEIVKHLTGSFMRRLG